MDKYKMISMRTLSNEKPICIVYNPNSGRMRDLVPIIEKRLNAANIKFEMINTKKAGDTYTMPRDEIDLDKYSMLVACGGDGTYHEVINGMLARKDGKKIPIGMLPNGSGNDTCRSLGAEHLD